MELFYVRRVTANERIDEHPVDVWHPICKARRAVVIEKGGIV